jgi:hypothetical protein
MTFNEWWNKKGFDAATAPSALTDLVKLMAICADAYIKGSLSERELACRHTFDRPDNPSSITFGNGTRVTAYLDSDEAGNHRACVAIDPRT